MKTHKKTILLLMAALGVIISALSASAVEVTIVSLPYTITAPGCYTLAQGYVNRVLSSTPVVIAVNASNVTVDLNGNNIVFNATTVQPSPYTGGIVANNQSNITIKNGAITFTGTAQNLGMVCFTNCQNSVVENIQFSATGTGARLGLYIYGVSDNGGTGNVIHDNQFNYVCGPITISQSVGGNVAYNNVINHSWGAIQANASSGGNCIKNNVLIYTPGFNHLTLVLGSTDVYEGNVLIGYTPGSVTGGINGGNNIGQ